MLAGDRCALEHHTWQGWQTDLLRALRRDVHRIPRCMPLFPSGACPHKSWAMGTGLPQLKCPIEVTVLRPASSSRKTRLVKSEPARQDPMKHAWQGLPHRQVPTKETSLWRLASGVIRAASSVSCNGTPAGESRTSALETPEGVASISAPLHFQAEETEMCARWRSLRPGTPYVAGLADRSPEGTEERRAPCTAVHATLPQRGRPSEVLGHRQQDVLAEDYPTRMTVRRSAFC